MDASALPIGKIICETNYPPALNHLNFFLWVLVCVNPSFFFFLGSRIPSNVSPIHGNWFIHLHILSVRCNASICFRVLLHNYIVSEKVENCTRNQKATSLVRHSFFYLFFEWYLVQHLSAKIERKGYTTLLSVVDSHVR